MTLDELKKEYIQKEQHVLDGMSKSERETAGHPIKSICELSKFSANGTEYIVGTSLTVSRFEKFEALQTQVGYGLSFKELFQNITKSYNYLNDSLPMDAGIVLYNILQGIRDKATGEENPILELCALFIYAEGEDLTRYDEAAAKSKIEDWKREGIDMESFFDFAFRLVQGLSTNYQKVSQSISKQVMEARKAAR